MGWRSPPSREHDEGVVDSDPQEKEGGGKVERDELHLGERYEDLDVGDEDLGVEAHPQVAGQPKAGQDGEHRCEETKETDQRLRTDL